MKTPYRLFLLILCLFQSERIYSQAGYYYYVGSNSSAKTLANWDDGTGGHPTDFSQGDLFDIYGYSLDMEGITVENNTTFSDGVGGGSVFNSGIFIINQVSTTFDASIASIDFSSQANTVKYTDASGSVQYIIGVEYHNLELSGTLKQSLGPITIKNQLTDVTGINLTFNHSLTFKINTSLTVQSGSNFILNFNNGDSITDNRTGANRNYYGNWTFNKLNKFINYGIFDSVTVANTIKLNSPVKIRYKLNYTPGTKQLNINGKTLTVEGTIYQSSTQTFIGSASSSLTCGASGTIYFRQLTTDSILRYLNITNGKTVTLGNNLKIVGGSNYGVVTVESGATLNTNGNLTLRSHSGGSAMIGNSAGTISGSIIAETFIPATARRFRFLSSPVTGATAVHWRNNGTYTKYKGLQITGGGANWSAQGFDESLTNNPSAFYYNEAAAGDDTTVSPGASNDAGWTAFGSGSEALVNGKGFRVLVRGDRGIDLKGTGGSTTPIATTLKVTGSYVGSSATINVTNSGRTKLNNGINFIGNPYPCTIDWDALTLTNVDPSYLIYDPSGNRYRAWNGTTGGAGRYISSGQAFLVYCTSTSGGSVTINEADKVTNTIGGGFFQNKLINHLKIELAYDTLNLDETYIHFRDDASDHLDRYDVRQVKNSGVNVASIDSANLSYNINSLGTLSGNRRIPLSVEGTLISNGFKLTFNDVASFPFHKIYLIDNFKGTKTLLKEAATTIVDITADKTSYQNGRFFLDFEEIAQTNIKKINNGLGVILFPNPTIDLINLEFGNTLQNKKFNYSIISIHGETLVSGDITAAAENKINIKNLASGAYFINISNSEKSQSIQFIKK